MQVIFKAQTNLKHIFNDTHLQIRMVGEATLIRVRNTANIEMRYKKVIKHYF